MPLPSTRRWRLEPGLLRAVGFGPVASPPFSPRTRRCRRRPGSSQWHSPCPAGRAARDVVAPIRRQLASPATCASRSSPVRSSAHDQPISWGRSPRDGQQAISPSTAWSASARRRRADAGAQDKHDPRQAGAVRPARLASFRLGRLRRQQGRNLLPQILRNQGCNHARPTPARPSGSVLIGALNAGWSPGEQPS